MRADFFDRPLQDPVIGPLVAGGTFGVTPLTPAELLEAIVGPGGRVGVAFRARVWPPSWSPRSSASPASLPLLQFALTELYDRRDGADGDRPPPTATSAAWPAPSPGAPTRSTIARRRRPATAPTSCSPDWWPSAKARTDTRRRVRLSELAHVPDSVIDRLRRATGSLAFDRDPATREPTVEVAHEALLVRWPRLRAWIDDDRAVARACAAT